MEKVNFVYERVRDESVLPIECFYTRGCSPHIHKATEILCVEKGDFDVGCGKERRVLTVGDVFFAGSYDIHCYDLLNPNAKGLVCILPDNLLGRYNANSQGWSPTTHFFNDATAFNSLVTLIKLFHDSKIRNNVFSEGIANAIMGVIRTVVPYEKEGEADKDDTMRQALIYIYKNHKEDITLQSLAKRYGYTPNHFSSLFNSLVPSGLKTFINTIRLDEAVALMGNGYSVIDAAMESGFNSFRTFYRCFSERYHCTPQEYFRKVDA